MNLFKMLRYVNFNSSLLCGIGFHVLHKPSLKSNDKLRLVKKSLHSLLINDQNSVAISSVC